MIPRYVPSLILYQAITSDVVQPHQKFKINLESLVFLQPEEKIKVRSRFKKEDRSQELEINKGSSFGVRLFKTYANKMFKGFLQGSKDKHMQFLFS